MTEDSHDGAKWPLEEKTSEQDEVLQNLGNSPHYDRSLPETQEMLEEEVEQMEFAKALSADLANPNSPGRQMMDQLLAEAKSSSPNKTYHEDPKEMTEEDECTFPTPENCATFPVTVRIEKPKIMRVAKERVAKIFASMSSIHMIQCRQPGVFLRLHVVHLVWFSFKLSIFATWIC